jgi:hypothetical protein
VDVIKGIASGAEIGFDSTEIGLSQSASGRIEVAQTDGAVGETTPEE